MNTTVDIENLRSEIQECLNVVSQKFIACHGQYSIDDLSSHFTSKLSVLEIKRCNSSITI